MSKGTYKIVVGFDGSDGSKKALAWAVNEARLRAGELRIIKAWTPGEFGGNGELAEIEAKNLAEDANAILGDHPAITYTLAAKPGHAAKVLLDESRGADMVVVGSRGHGGFGGLLMGSVGMQVTSHATAAVVIIVKGDDTGM